MKRQLARKKKDRKIFRQTARKVKVSMLRLRFFEEVFACELWFV